MLIDSAQRHEGTPKPRDDPTKEKRPISPVLRFLACHSPTQNGGLGRASQCHHPALFSQPIANVYCHIPSGKY